MHIPTETVNKSEQRLHDVDKKKEKKNATER